ncbi:MAG TPA: single-stranded DNA-binding protein [Chitinophagales bacterium]|nr:single-stranded DNA-binding protein [Chitinophagales bacterium]
MINKVFLIGRLGKDPVIKHFSNDNAIAEFTLATDDSYKDKQGNKVEQTDWHNIKIPTRKLAEVAEKYLRKGSLIHVEGKIKTRSYDDKDGNKKYITEIVAETFKMLDSKKDSSGGGGSSSGNYSSSSNSNSSFNEEAPANTSSGADDDLPF